MRIFSLLKNKPRITNIFPSFVLVTFGFLFCKVNIVTAQEDSINKPLRFTRDIYIEDFSNSIHINPFLIGADNGFELNGKETFRYKPNQSVSLGLRLTHKWLSVAFSYGPKNVQENKYGATDHLNLVLNTYGKRIGADLYYLKYKGYYMSNPRNVPELEQQYQHQFPIYPDLSTLNIGFNIAYIFNHRKYSYRSTFLHNDIQRKTAGSFILTGSYSFYRISSDTGIVPGEIFSYVVPGARITSGDFNSVSIMPGYSFTLVGLQRFFITMAPSLGPMLQHQSYTVDNGNKEKQRSDIVPRAMLKGGFGFNSRKFYIGYSGIIDSYIVPLSEGQFVNYFISSNSIYLGIRIGVPKPFQKASDFLEKYDPRKVLFKQQD
jgi:hypothetical protein